MECRLTRWDNEVIWIALRGHLTEGINSGNSFLFCMLTDVSDQVDKRNRIRAQFQRESDYATELAAPNLIAKAQANLTEDTFESYSGLGGSEVEAYFTSVTVDEAMRYISDSAVFKEDATRFLEQFSRQRLIDAYAGGETDHSVEFRRKRIDGRMIWCRTVGRTYLTPETNHLTLFVYSFDITEEWLSRRLLEQASMIGLNATIEAARLGQTGKTIAVVAEEIRKLADTTKLTVASIDSIKEAIEKSVSSTVHSANDTLNSTSEQAAAMEELSAAVQSSSSLAELLKDMSQKH